MSYEDSPVDMEVSDGEEPGAALSDMDVSNSSSVSSRSSVCSNEDEYLTHAAKRFQAPPRLLASTQIRKASLSHEDDDNASQSSYHTACDWFDPLDEGESGGEPGEIVDDPRELARQLQVAEKKARQAAEEVQRYEKRRQELDEQIMRREIRLSLIQKRAAESLRPSSKQQQQQQQQLEAPRPKRERKRPRNRNKRRMQLMHRRQKRGDRQHHRQREEPSFADTAAQHLASHHATVREFWAMARGMPASAPAPPPMPVPMSMSMSMSMPVPVPMATEPKRSVGSFEQSGPASLPMRPTPARRPQPHRQTPQPTSDSSVPALSHTTAHITPAPRSSTASSSASPAYRPPISIAPSARLSSMTPPAPPRPPPSTAAAAASTAAAAAAAPRPASKAPVRPALAARNQEFLPLEPQQTLSQRKKPSAQTHTPHQQTLTRNGQTPQQEQKQIKPSVKHSQKGHFTPHRLPFQVRDRSPERAANADGGMCLYELVGGTCNDDTCKARHFRDFQGESSSPATATTTTTAASPSSASPSTHVFGNRSLT